MHNSMMLRCRKFIADPQPLFGHYIKSKFQVIDYIMFQFPETSVETVANPLSHKKKLLNQFA